MTGVINLPDSNSIGKNKKISLQEVIDFFKKRGLPAIVQRFDDGTIVIKTDRRGLRA